VQMKQIWLLWFVAFSVVARAERDSGDNAASTTMDDVSENMHVELLQRDLKLSHREQKLEHLGTDEVIVNKWKCPPGQVAYQSTTTNDNSWTKFKVMHLNNGSYGDVVDVDLTKFSSKKGEGLIRSMNSCAINPYDDILYCSMEIYDKGSFLVAIDQENNIGFVNKLLGFRYAASFDWMDNYYTSGKKGFSVVKNVSKKPKYATFDILHNKLCCKRHEGETVQPLWIQGKTEPVYDYELGQDYAWYQHHVYLPGGTHAYLATKLATLKNNKLLLIDIDHGPPFEVEIMDTNVDTGPGGIRVWGAAWNFGGAIYFAADDGKGFWSMEDIETKTELVDGKLVDKKKAIFEWKGPANKIDWNDGFTCTNKTIVQKTPKSPCKHDFYQVTTYGSMSSPERSTESTTVIRHLDPVTGSFTEDFKVNRAKFAGMNSLNACAVNPKDRKLYCHMKHNNYQAIAVVDEKNTLLVTKFNKGGARPRSKMCFAAVFDSSGTYWFWCGGGSMGGETLYSVADLHKKEGTLSIDADSVKDDSQIKAHCCDYLDNNVGADFVTKVEGDKTYLVSIVESATNDVSVIDITDSSNPGKPVIYKPEGLPPPKDAKKPNIWGSAWTAPKKGKYAERVFFARDADPKEKESMGKLYEMTGLDTAGKVAKFKEAGKAANAAWHDGFACQEKIVGIDDR